MYSSESEWISSFSESQIISDKYHYFLIFNQIPYFRIILERLQELNFNVKDKDRFHITIGDIEEVTKSTILNQEIISSILNKKLSEKLYEYFTNLKWCITIATLDEMPVKWYYQIML